MNAQTTIELPPDTQLRAALASALPELGTVSKNKDNPHFKSRYADLAAVIQSLEPLKAHGLWFRQVPVEAETGVAFETFYLHTSGAELSAGVMHMPVDRGNAQGIGSAQTYCRRYALQAAFGLAADDDDGNAAAAAPPAEKPKREPAHSALKTKLREFVHTMEGIGDWDEWCAYRDTKEVRSLVSEVQEKLPQWWDGGPDMQAEFVPLRRRIEILEGNLANQIADYAKA